ncbi:type II-A CRISPR-associated protein Csn2 [Facklamia sp. P12937]|uniref:type II-A CRISPR-associated protein Csn2 n=1 Tax=Facklamia sp. P12937 TaxID=3421949 RepID=UPI003D17B16B
MKINFKMLDQPLLIECPTLLVIEEVKLFSNIIEQIYSYTEEAELKFYDHKNNNLKANEMVIITDILGYQINSTTFLNIIYQDIIDQLNETPEKKNQLEQTLHQLLVQVDDALIDSELDLIANEVDIKAVLKLFNVTIATDYHSINERFYDIVQVVNYLKKKKLLIIINSLSYLTRDQVHDLFEYITSYGLRTLFIEPRKLYGYPQYVIDSEYYVYKFEE